MREYQTARRQLLLAFFQQHRTRKLTIDDLTRELAAEAVISRSAIYRNLDKMTRDGLLTRTLEPTGRKALYQLSVCEQCCERVHLRCEKCGKVMHMENPADELRLATLLEQNGFELDEHATVLVGVCKDCK